MGFKDMVLAFNTIFFVAMGIGAVGRQARQRWVGGALAAQGAPPAGGCPWARCWGLLARAR